MRHLHSLRSWALAGILCAAAAAPASAQTLDELLKAVQGNHPEAVTSILDSKPDLVRQGDGHGHTALYEATYMNRPALVTMLIARGADVNQPTTRNTLPLHAACEKGNLEIATVLVNSGSHLDDANNEGLTPLHLAALYGYEEVARLLLSKGASVKTRDPNGATPLHEAARRGSVDIVKQILAAGANPDAHDDFGRTPIDIAQLNKHGDWPACIVVLKAAPRP